jgi:hypothetical protein
MEKIALSIIAEGHIWIRLTECTFINEKARLWLWKRVSRKGTLQFVRVASAKSATMASPVTASPEAEISIKMRNSNGTHRGTASNDSYCCELIPVLKDLRQPRVACKSNIQQGLPKVLSFDSERAAVHPPRRKTSQTYIFKRSFKRIWKN